MTRARAALRTAALAVAGPVGRLVRGLPGIAAVVCTVTAVWMLAGVAWALLAAVPFLLIADSRTT